MFFRSTLLSFARSASVSVFLRLSSACRSSAAFVRFGRRRLGGSPVFAEVCSRRNPTRVGGRHVTARNTGPPTTTRDRRQTKVRQEKKRDGRQYIRSGDERTGRERARAPHDARQTQKDITHTRRTYSTIQNPCKARQGTYETRASRATARSIACSRTKNMVKTVAEHTVNQERRRPYLPGAGQTLAAPRALVLTLFA